MQGSFLRIVRKQSLNTYSDQRQLLQDITEEKVRNGPNHVLNEPNVCAETIS